MFILYLYSKKLPQKVHKFFFVYLSGYFTHFIKQRQTLAPSAVAYDIFLVKFLIIKNKESAGPGLQSPKPTLSY